jgi:hypothetical protein
VGLCFGAERWVISGGTSPCIPRTIERILSLKPSRQVVPAELKRETSRTPALCSENEDFGFNTLSTSAQPKQIR